MPCHISPAGVEPTITQVEYQGKRRNGLIPFVLRARFYGGPKQQSLQSKAGYIDARPHVCQLDEILLQRNGRTIHWVSRVASVCSRRLPHVRYASDTDRSDIRQGS